jgi:hypothetical protein
MPAIILSNKIDADSEISNDAERVRDPKRVRPEKMPEHIQYENKWIYKL